MSFGLVLCLWGATSGPGRLAGFRGPHLSAPPLRSLPPHPPAGAGAQRSSEVPLLRVVRTLTLGSKQLPPKRNAPPLAVLSPPGFRLPGGHMSLVT